MAKWSAKYPGCSGHIHQSLSDGKKNLFFDAKGRNSMSKLFESYLAGQVSGLMELAPMYWPTINSYKRLVDGFWAPVKPTWGVDNRTASFRVLPGSPKATRLETRCPGADVNPYLAMAAVIAAGLHGVEKGMKLVLAFTGDREALLNAVETLGLPNLVQPTSDPLAMTIFLPTTGAAGTTQAIGVRLTFSARSIGSPLRTITSGMVVSFVSLD